MHWMVSSIKSKFPRVGLGYLIGGLLMLAGAVCEYFIGVEAVGKSLETVSSPLQSAN